MMASPETATATATTARLLSGQSLVDRLIDSQLDWRQLIREANGGAGAELNQLSEAQMKRQEVIHELVQTERHHCLTLALMRQVYLAGLRRLNETRAKQHQEMNPSSQPDLIDLDRLFPALEDLIQAHELFFAHLRLQLLDSCTPAAAASSSSSKNSPRPFLGFVGPMGDLLCDQFRLHQRRQQSANCEQEAAAAAELSSELTNGQKLLQAYGKFCGAHLDSSKYYKQLMHNDKGFRQFIEVSYCCCGCLVHCNLKLSLRRSPLAARRRGVAARRIMVDSSIRPTDCSAGDKSAGERQQTGSSLDEVRSGGTRSAANCSGLNSTTTTDSPETCGFLAIQRSDCRTDAGEGALISFVRPTGGIGQQLAGAHTIAPEPKPEPEPEPESESLELGEG